MEEDLFCYLDSYQVLALLYKIRDIEEKHPGYNDSVANNFKKESKEQAAMILKIPSIVLRIFPKKATYKFSKSMINYLNNITDTDVFDENNTEEYIQITEMMEEENKNRKKLKNTKNN